LVPLSEACRSHALKRFLFLPGHLT
jgi:hypothetical protein